MERTTSASGSASLDCLKGSLLAAAAFGLQRASGCSESPSGTSAAANACGSRDGRQARLGRRLLTRSRSYTNRGTGETLPCIRSGDSQRARSTTAGQHNTRSIRTNRSHSRRETHPNSSTLVVAHSNPTKLEVPSRQDGGQPSVWLRRCVLPERRGRTSPKRHFGVSLAMVAPWAGR
jgi:hypothetical protein